MTDKRYTYQGTWETEDSLGNVNSSTEVRIHYTMSWGMAPITNALPENCDPGSSDHVEVEAYEVEDLEPGGSHFWREPTKDEDFFLEIWVDGLYDQLIEDARETEEIDREDALASAAEARADAMRWDD